MEDKIDIAFFITIWVVLLVNVIIGIIKESE